MLCCSSTTYRWSRLANGTLNANRSRWSLKDNNREAVQRGSTAETHRQLSHSLLSPLLVKGDTHCFSFVSFAALLAWSSGFSLHRQMHRCERTRRNKHFTAVCYLLSGHTNTLSPSSPGDPGDPATPGSPTGPSSPSFPAGPTGPFSPWRTDWTTHAYQANPTVSIIPI